VVEHPDPERGTRLGAFALWFLNVSTWTGTHGVYLEDLYVRPELRGSGYGRRLLQTLAQLCQDRGYRRLEWWVLDWNEPALGFYRNLGALPMDEWTVHRVTGDDLAALAAGADPAAPDGAR
jgi:GNAT superfamily N-acetyltransferase